LEVAIKGMRVRRVRLRAEESVTVEGIYSVGRTEKRQKVAVVERLTAGENGHGNVAGVCAQNLE